MAAIQTENIVGLRRILHMALHMLDEVRSVKFQYAVQESMKARSGRRPRTLSEIRSICSRLMREFPGLAEREVCSITRMECAEMVKAWPSTRQQHKIRVILHGVFEYSRRQEWCLENPAAFLQLPLLREKEIPPLDWAELQRLTRTARKPEHRACMPPLGLMLWAGVRPAEVERLCWHDIDWEDGVISLRSLHTKTGGCRHIRLHDVLRHWLRECINGSGRICPPNWQRRWQRLRAEAALIPWRQDVLRHTFASYHAKHFHNFAALQEDMGHRSSALLRTRYLSMRGITARLAARFWTPHVL